MELTIGLAFLAGIVSFLSPCVLPLVPAYVGYMGGRMTNMVAAAQTIPGSAPGAQRPARMRFGTAVHGVFFVAGFTLVFVAIGLLSTAFIQQVGGANISLVTSIIGRIGGVIIIFFGLHFMGVMPSVFAKLRAHHDTWLDNVLASVIVALVGGAILAWGFTGTLTLWNTPLWDTVIGIPIVATTLLASFWLWLLRGGAFTRPGAFWIATLNRLEAALYGDTRQQMAASGNQGYFSSGLMGIVFAAGWTPCIGPVYGAVLTLAASGGDVGEAGVMLTAYSLGLGMPFLLTALMLDSAQGVLRRLQRHMRTIELVSGSFLIAIGLSIASGQLQDLSAQFAGDFAEFSVNLEESVISFVQGDDAAEIEDADETPDTTTGGYDLSALEVGLDVGNLAPDFSTVTDTGEPIALSDLRGQVVLLNFWATWCGPCRLEMPALQQQFEARGGKDFTILAVDNGEPVEDIIAFREEFGLTFLLAVDEKAAILDLYGIFSMPSTFVLDKNGVIVARHFGPLVVSQIEQFIDNAASF